MIDLSIKALEVTFPGLATPALSIDEFRLAAGGKLAVTGASGSGKSTLVNILTGLERPRTGAVRWGGTDIASLSESRRDRWRGETIGLVMQDFYLFEGLSALDNILLPARLARAATAEMTERARELLRIVGLSRPEQKVETMSRGEMQRVAVARAVVRRPAVIIADEPTASLDSESGAQVADLIMTLAEREGSTLIVVSHDPALIGRFDKRIRLVGGRIAAETIEAAA
ncbi:ABC transporter ATP-binding protein [Rhizobium sp. C4]|uniref:ABC transporter ATP-binding protein n=1 Tax=Rhizobium sp. C4 TaxID=1349800 RepID=UPI001E631ECD|nr:ATP-binding cassette domain-containing protein [Rhizobium sp. C4]MCD2173405.1 ATP-binding cassette domain-containing protein [Rhizobium sp. C4]